MSTNLAQRFKSIYSCCPDIQLVTTFPYGRPLEQWLHEFFNTTRVSNTEWFASITETDIDAIIVPNVCSVLNCHSSDVLRKSRIRETRRAQVSRLYCHRSLA